MTTHVKVEEAVALLGEVRELGRRAGYLIAELTRAGIRTSQPNPVVLTPREETVLRGIADGLTNASLARLLNLSPHTVKDHTSALYRKLGVSNRSGAVGEAMRRGLV